MQNPAEGQYFASIQELDDDGTSNYNGLLLSVQRRRGNGLSIQGNYAISRCITDRWNSEPGVAGVPYMIPGNREADRGKCPNSPEHNLNASVVYQIPGAGGRLRSPRADQRLAGVGNPERPVGLVLHRDHRCRHGVDRPGDEPAREPDPRRSVHAGSDASSQWLNPAAFQAAGARHLRDDAA